MDLDYVTRLVIAPLVLMTIWRHSFDFCDSHRLDPDAYIEHHIELLLNGLIAGERARLPCGRERPARVIRSARTAYEDIRHAIRLLIAALAAAAGALPWPCACRPATRSRSRSRTCGRSTWSRSKLDGAATQTTYTGDVRARYETALGFRVAGKIVERKVEVGSRVTRGEVLARLDPSDYQLNIEAAKSQLAAARSDFAAGQGRAQALPRAVREEVHQRRRVRSPPDHLRRGQGAARAGPGAAGRHAQPVGLHHAARRSGRHRHGDRGRGRPGRDRRSDRDAGGAPGGEGGRGQRAREPARASCGRPGRWRSPCGPSRTRSSRAASARSRRARTR